MRAALLHFVSIPKMGKKLEKPPTYIEPPAYDQPTPFGAHEGDQLIKSSTDDAESRFEAWLQQESCAFEKDKPRLVGDEEAFTQYLERKYPDNHREGQLRNAVHLIQDIEQSLGLSNAYQAASTRRHSRVFAPLNVHVHANASTTTLVAPPRPGAYPAREQTQGSLMHPLLLATIRRDAIGRRNGSPLRALIDQGMSQDELLRGASNNERLQIVGLLRRSQNHSRSH